MLPATAAVVRAELAGPDAFEAALGFYVPEAWPPEFHGAEALEWTLERIEPPDARLGWYLHYVGALGAAGRRTRLVGVAGFKGPPRDGTVEIGYSILEDERGMGFATEAARALVACAFHDADVRRVVAETLPELVKSIGVLERSGFTPASDPSTPDVVRYEVRRSAWESLSCRA